MKIVHDVPGRRLRLEGAEAGFPPQLGCLLVFLLPFCGSPLGIFGAMFSGATADRWVLLFGLVFSAFWYGALALGAYSVLRATRAPRLLQLDRGAGEAVVAERGAFGLFASEEVIPLRRLAGARVALVSRTTRGAAQAAFFGGGGGQPLRLSLSIRRGDADDAIREREVVIDVEHLDKREEVADFAFRLAGAAGLGHHRIVRNDPRAFEAEFSASPAPGLQPVPRTERAADYARDAVAPAAHAAVREERVPPFEPARFQSDHRVSAWSPGQEVRFEKPLGFAAFGCLPFVLAAGAGPLLFIGLGGRGDVDPVARLMFSGFIGLFGVVIAGVAAAAVVSSLPRRVVLDWTSRAITIAGLTSRKEIPFADLTTLELRGHRVYHSSKNSSYHSYHCELRAHYSDPATGQTKTEMLVETNRFREDPDTPYRQALPLVTDLAGALHVERRITDYA